MLKRHKNNSGKLVPYMFSRTHRLTEQLEPSPLAHEARSAPHRDTSSHVDWELLWTWGLVIFSFAALLFCMYVIRAKCQGNSPF